MRTTLTTSLQHPRPQRSLVRLGRGKRPYLRQRGHLTCHSSLRVWAIKGIPFTRKLEVKALTPHIIPSESLLSVLWHGCSVHLFWVDPRPRALQKERVGCAGGLCCRWRHAHAAHHVHRCGAQGCQSGATGPQSWMWGC